jgi:hypothetical protein
VAAAKRRPSAPHSRDLFTIRVALAQLQSQRFRTQTNAHSAAFQMR